MSIKLSGKILTDLGFPASNVRVEAYEYDVNAAPKQIGNVASQADGTYNFDLGDRKSANIHLRIVDIQTGKELGKTPMQQLLVEKAQIYWAIPSAKEQSEYQRLRQDLKVGLAGANFDDDELFTVALSGLEENPDKNRRDFTLLAQKIGWDSRVIAMFVKAEAIGEDATMRQYYYAAFRAGLPIADDRLLHRADIKDVMALWKQAATDKIIYAELGKTDAIKAAAEKFRSKAQNLQLRDKGEGSFSDVGTMLRLTLATDADAIRFLDLYSTWKGTMPDFWKMLKDTNAFPENIINSLQIDAQLGNLTFNHAPLIQRLKATIGVMIDDLVRLALAGFFRADKWNNPTLFADTEIPDGITGTSIADRRQKYAQFMADQIRKSYPTAVMAILVNERFLPLSANEEAPVFGYLSNLSIGHINKPNTLPFEFGTKMVKNTEGFSNIAQSTQTELKKLERTFQLTPDDDSMRVLLVNNLHSAAAIVKLNRSAFFQQFGKLFRPSNTTESQQIAESIFQKAIQIHTTTLNMAIALATYKGNPLVPVIDGNVINNQDPRAVLNYPTLETLFGNLDYCECEHCRSVLSPAAYLVDLLEFLNRTQDMDGTQLSINPLDVLLQRRPDIGNLELSCENTNTAMPYIDLVNEILEYYIFNSHQNNPNLNGFIAKDIAENTVSEDLIAAPRSVRNPNITTQVYDTILKTTKLPAPLPFNQPLEALRTWYDVHETALSDMMLLLKESSNTLTSVNPYGWEDIFLEILRLSREEYKILTDPIPVAELPRYFDFVPTTATPLLELSNARTFCQATDLTYKELIELLKQPFINTEGTPNTLVLLNDNEIKFNLLNISLAKAATIVQTPTAAVQLPLGIPASLYDNDPTAWLRFHFELISDLKNNVVSMDNLFLRRNVADLNQNKPTAFDFTRLMRWIRLWRKTSWSMSNFARICSVFSQEPEFTPMNEANIDHIFRLLTYRCAILTQIRQKLGLTKNKGFEDFIQLWDKNPTMRGQAAEQRQWDALARLLKMKVADIQLLSRVSASEPFLFQNIFPTSFLNDNIYNTDRILIFIDVVRKVKTAKIRLKELDYVFMHNDIDGKLTPSVFLLHSSILQIKATLRQIDTELSQVSDIDSLKSKVGQVFDADMTDLFFELLTDQKVFTTTLDIVELPIELEAWSVRSRLLFDDFDKKLSVKGRMKIADIAALPIGIADNIRTAVQELELLGKASIDNFFAKFPTLKPAFDAYELAEPKDKLFTLLNMLMPELKPRLQNQAIRQIVASAARADVELIGAFLEDSGVLSSNINVQNPIIQDLMDLTIDNNFLKTGGTAYVEVPNTEGYLFSVESQDTVQISMQLDNQLILSGTVSAGSPLKMSVPIPLKAGQLYSININVNSAKPILIKARTRNAANPIIIHSQIIGQAGLNKSILALNKIFKATQLARLFRLNALEIKYLCSQKTFKLPPNNVKCFLNALPTERADVGTQEARLAVSQAISLVDYVLLRDKFDQISEGLLLILIQQPLAQLPTGKVAF